MSLQWISILMGVVAAGLGGAALFAPQRATNALTQFPRSRTPAVVLTLLCCVLGARESLMLNMGFLNAYKGAIYVLAPLVFVACLVYLKELLAPRALGGFLLLIAAPILRTARWHDSPWRLVVISLVYLGIVAGLFLLLSPWWFRRATQPLIRRPMLLRVVGGIAAGVGVLLIVLGAAVF